MAPDTSYTFKNLQSRRIAEKIAQVAINNEQTNKQTKIYIHVLSRSMCINFENRLP
jgi:hypothetical protein